MIDVSGRAEATALPTSRWHELASQVQSGHRLTLDQGRAILQSPDTELPDLLAAAFRLREAAFGRTVQLYFLMNAKSGLCPEDCGYCSQSKVSDAEIPRYNLLNREKLLDGARVAHERGSKTYCMVISARGPTDREIQAVVSVVPEIKSRYNLEICACLGLLTPDQAQRLKDCGVDKVNHNLNTSERFYPEICTTHTYQDRLDTLRAVRGAGMQLCSGGIVGMGENDDDIVHMAQELGELGVESIPVNFLNPVDGTPLSGTWRLTPRYCLKVLCLFRFACPKSEIRIAGGRELHLRSLQPWGLLPANSMFVGDYLTTSGQPPEADYQMIADLGFEITRREEVVSGPAGALAAEVQAASAR